MKFHQKDDIAKSILVLSDLHLGAGKSFRGKINFLEDFHQDQELIDFLNYYSSGEWEDRDVELILNGDIIDFLAVPFVNYFDDQFWSETATLEKLELVIQAHRQVFEALASFVSSQKRKIVYIIGNHDAEMILPSLQRRLKSLIAPDGHGLVFIANQEDEYRPHAKVAIKHGHEFELASIFHVKKSFKRNESGDNVFIPPWGSFYVSRVMNRFKLERHYVDSVRPINNFMIYGLIYDTLFTVRFILASLIYYVMVRFIYFFERSRNIHKIWKYMSRELKLFRDYESITETILTSTDQMQILIMGHTHLPSIREYDNGSTFINTGTWKKMYRLGFVRGPEVASNTYAKIDISKNDPTQLSSYTLNAWVGTNQRPYTEIR